MFDNLPKTAVDAKRYHGDEPEGERKESRFRPLKEGTLVLVRLEMDVDAFGLVPVHATEKSTSVSAKVHIESGRSTGRWFFQSFMLTGYEPRVRESMIFLRRALSCFDIDIPKDSRHFGRIANRIIPARLVIRPHWQTKKPGNAAEAIAADPRSEVYRDYLKLVDKLEERVPGWDLYDQSRAKDLIVRRRMEAKLIVGTDTNGKPITAADVRKIRNAATSTEGHAVRAEVLREIDGRSA